MIMAPTRFDRVIIPSATMGYACGYREEYLQVVRAVVEAALEQGNEKNFPIYKNIYFTRTQFRKSQKNEVGEKAIESVFEKVGFTVLSPEKLSLIEQIFYIHNCNVMVCMTGTIPHNAIFAGKTTQVVLLNRTCKTNPPQVAINKLAGVDVVYIDVYTKQILKHPRDYGGKNGGPIWVEVNDNLKRYLKDSGYSLPKSGNWNSATRKLKDTLYFEVLSCLKVIKNYLADCSVYQKFKSLAKKKR